MLQLIVFVLDLLRLLLGLLQHLLKLRALDLVLVAFVYLFLEVVGDFLQLFVLLLQLVLQFFDVLVVLEVLQFFNLLLQFLNLHLFATDVLLQVFVVVVCYFEVFLEGVDLYSAVFDLGFVFSQFELVAVVNISVLFLLFVGEV